MLQYYSYSLPSTLGGRASQRGVKRKFDSFRCGYASSSEPSNSPQNLPSPISGQQQDRKKQQSLFRCGGYTLSTPLNQHDDADAYACFGGERVQSMDLDLSVAYKSTSSFTPSSSCISTSSVPSFPSSSTSLVGSDSVKSRGGKQQLGIKMFFNSITSTRLDHDGRDLTSDAALKEGKGGIIETCVFCISPKGQVFPRMTSVSCAFCNRSSCPDCITDCEICNYAFCKLCITTNYDYVFDKIVCLDCNTQHNDDASKIVYSF